MWRAEEALIFEIGRARVEEVVEVMLEDDRDMVIMERKYRLLRRIYSLFVSLP